jgi:hypothetical protein
MEGANDAAAITPVEPATKKPKGAGSGKQAALGSIGFVKLLQPREIDALKGTQFALKGDFWPDCNAADKTTKFDMLVLGTVSNWKPSPGASDRT